jgi:class 3 adenylate cyclase/tetratricopeptide (TPR) repeat protein
MKNNQIVLFMILLLTINIAQSRAQSSEEAIKKYSSMKNSEAKVDAMISVAEKLFATDSLLSVKIFDEAANLALKINYHEGFCESHYSKGFLFFDRNQYGIAKNEFQSCLSHSDDMNISHRISCLDALAWIEEKEGNDKAAAKYYDDMLNIYLEKDSSDAQISAIYTKIGNSYLKMKIFYAAHERYWKALEYANRTKDKSLISSCYVNMGIIKRNLNYLWDALKYNLDALILNRDIGDNVKIAVNLANISQVYLEMDSLDKAMKYAFEALDNVKQKNNQDLIPYMLGAVADVYFKQENYTEALNYSQQSLNINKEINNTSGYYSDLLRLSIIQLKARKNIASIRKNLDSVIRFAELNALFPLLADAYKTMSEYYYYQNTIDSMYHYMELTEKTKKDIYDSNINNELSYLKDRLIFEQNMKEESIKQEAKQKGQRTIIIALLLGAVVLFFVSIVVWTERRKSEKLLLNVLPKSIASRLKSKENLIADRYESASIVFIDIVQFTLMSRNVDPDTIVELLNNIYTTFDSIAEKHGLEKIKTIGDCYMAVAGAPIPMKDHAHSAAKFALEAMDKIRGVACKDGSLLEFRCGIDCGPIIAGIIGRKKFIYDLWGDAVNTASRMEEYGEPGKIQVTDRFRETLSLDGMTSKVDFVERGEVDIKGKGLMTTYFLEKKADSLN